MNSVNTGSIRVVIADDEPAARTSTEILLKSLSAFTVVASCSDGAEVVDAITTLQPDLVLLDIQMPEKNGFEVVEAVLGQHVPVFVFITAYDQYAIKAFEKCALDYLLKPYDDERFYASMARAQKLIIAEKSQSQTAQLPHLLALLSNAAPAPASYINRLPIKHNGKITFLPVDAILYIESEGNFVKLYTDSETKIGSYNFKKLETVLNPRQFARIHKSYIVNLDHVASIESYFHGDYLVVLKNNQRLKLSRTYKAAFDKLVLL